SKGLGKAVARYLAAEGCRLAICSRNEAELENTANEIKQNTGSEIIYRTVDVKNKSDIERFIRDTLKQYGTVDILVTNAGGPPVKSFEESTEEEWFEWYEITFMSVVRSVKAVLPTMKKNNFGRIIHITSISVKAPVERLIYSNSLRLAVVGLAKSLANELGQYGITVHNVAPGYHLTDGLERIIRKKIEAGAKRKNILEEWEQHIPLHKIGNPQDLAGIVTFLASEQAGYLTGTTIQVDGGLYPGIL
ncbi:MAG TPA: SDR family oxidoreductase, partial [Calditrichaeota bacterium]|nr:SDR family oxidoreductase [Calditrichota bacterium]